MRDTSVMKAQHPQLLLMSQQMVENLVQLAIIAFLESNSQSLASLVQKMTKLSKVLVKTVQKVNTVKTLQ
jgi:hypothetical protein